jgi:photoactive yellow protein
MALQRVEVTPEELVSEIGMIGALDIDALPFGAIQLDRDGTVLAYNRFEADLASRRKEDVVGKNFFREVAPCTRVKKFFGAFEEGIERHLLNEVFDFVFQFPSGAREVRIRMIYSASPTPGVWIFTTPMK